MSLGIMHDQRKNAHPRVAVHTQWPVPDIHADSY